MKLYSIFLHFPDKIQTQQQFNGDDKRDEKSIFIQFFL